MTEEDLVQMLRFWNRYSTREPTLIERLNMSMNMKKTAAVAALAVAAAIGMSACTTVGEASTPDKFGTVNVDGTKCIVWKPADDTPKGSQMECDFR
ncbi:hypothetical protein AVU87_gp33 [Mycobacterium phage Theia]|uniref:Uncharacterized protein n=1 Tax=Mycobacterium phage Theia TaxID=1718172 RepID=A0A0N9STY6_9CAUD|nr:hypothetical protein AVU87_gp33 [Mycobacterium phage Theia]ALH46912.1 hypothetical protein SEA_THEIA_60 [Mycobacterium phage Theia]AXC33335.1 hypothetical protein SEA_DUBLIN_61 [Mycobacterium phage Dublin]